ncbi:major facilitator superfamily domain-containing protein [Aspergillus stella-maris]|uniref:major facilitator superfamily domain-containing protein n=1 Tax=Aspergillus stella-maris TaxID=1810926 RepID=UPI003CCD164E
MGYTGLSREQPGGIGPLGMMVILPCRRLATPETIETQEPELYSTFTTLQKWTIVSISAYAAWFSTLSSLIYYPAIPSLSTSLDTSISKINLTVTVYMAVASIAPALVGDTADILGRRPVYIVTLGVYFVTNVAIAVTERYSALLGLRVLQALSISGTFSIAYGVIADVTAPAERGSFAALVSFAIGVAPTLGPILGGALTYAAGWPWIFWFLCIASGSCLLIVTLFLPETCRGIVGDGSGAVRSYQRPLVPGIMSSGQSQAHACEDTNAETRPGSKRRFPNPLRSITLLLRPDNAIIITACGLMYTVYTCIMASLATLFVPTYDLTQWEAGLIYIPFGAGGIVSTFISGRILNQAWRDARIKRGLPVDKGRGDDLDTFPVEKARLGVIWVPMALTVAFVVGSGWALHFQTHMAVPLVLHFFAGLVMQLDFSVYNTLLVDKNHRSPAAAQAASNILRGTLSAVMISFLQDMIDRAGIGWTFTFQAGLCLMAGALFVTDYRVGMQWRQRSRQKELQRGARIE